MTSPERQSIRERFQAAEDAIKLYERVTLANLSSAVNELRYAGHHLLAADCEKDEMRRADLLVRADHHCQRASYDAKEGVILALLDYLAEFRDERFTSDELAEVLPDWQAVLASARSAQKLLERAGCVKRFEGDEGDCAIARLLDVRDTLMDAATKIEDMRRKKEVEREQADRMAAERERAEAEYRERVKCKTEDRRHVQNVALAIMGIALSVSSVALAIISMTK